VGEAAELFGLPINILPPLFTARAASFVSLQLLLALAVLFALSPRARRRLRRLWRRLRAPRDAGGYEILKEWLWRALFLAAVVGLPALAVYLGIGGWSEWTPVALVLGVAMGAAKSFQDRMTDEWSVRRGIPLEKPMADDPHYVPFRHRSWGQQLYALFGIIQLGLITLGLVTIIVMGPG
jgi:hypothetical protein